MDNGEKPPVTPPPKRDIVQKAETAVKVGKVAKALITKNAGDALGAAGKSAAVAGTGAADVAARSAAGVGKSTAGGVGALIPGDAKEALGKVAQATGPDANDDSIKGTVSNTLKGAVSGAATGAASGALAGGVGAAPGAIIGAASSAFTGLMANKTGRNALIVAAIAIVLVPLLIAGSIGLAISMTVAAALGGTQAASVESMLASGFTDDEIQAALQNVGDSIAPWQMVKAIEDQSEQRVDSTLLDAEMRKVDSSLEGFEMNTGAVFVADESWRTISTDDATAVAAAKVVRDNWVAVLEEYEKTYPLDPNRTYNLALAWYLGEKLNECSAELQGLDTREFTLADGSTRTLDNVQMANAIAIVRESRNIPAVNQNAVTIAIMAALTESSLKNYANSTIPESLTFPHDAVGNDNDSLGFWQMRQSWGTTAELMTVAYQVKAFYGGEDGPNAGSPRGLFDIPDWQELTKGEAAQAVEVSAFPDRYAENEAFAVAIMSNFMGGGVFGVCGSLFSGEFSHPLGDPAAYGISSMFGKRTPFQTSTGWTSAYHWGIDFGAPCGAPLYAITDATVIEVRFQGGWGNTVDLQLDDGTKLKYAHQPFGFAWPAIGERVRSGQQIGAVGTTGSSTGCHLHLEVTPPDSPRTDPYDWMVERGIPLVYQNRFVEGYRPGGPTMW